MLGGRATAGGAHGRTLGEHQTVQNWIADSAAEMHAARLITLHAAWIADNHGFAAARREISLIKPFGVEAMINVVDRALQAHGSLLGDKQTVQNWIADSAAQMQAARLMTLHAAWKMDTEGASAARQDIALIKFFGAQVLHDVVDRALQLHGSLGYSTDLPLEAMYRFARAARLYDGPDEVHRQSVARQILRGYEAPADGVPTEHVPTRREAARARFADLLEAVTSND